MTFLALLWWLLVAHALTDYAWQPEAMGRFKNPTDHGAGTVIGRRKTGPWWWSMGAHALINGGGVGIVTGRWELGLAETGTHFLLDTLKCYGKISTVSDQVWHLVSKLIWAGLVTYGG